MSVEEIARTEECRSIIEDYRGMCFWNVSEDFLPRTRRDFLLVADNLEKYGDMRAYRIAGEIRKWL